MLGHKVHPTATSVPLGPNDKPELGTDMDVFLSRGETGKAVFQREHRVRKEKPFKSVKSAPSEAVHARQAMKSEYNEQVKAEKLARMRLSLVGPPDTIRYRDGYLYIEAAEEKFKSWSKPRLLKELQKRMDTHVLKLTLVPTTLAEKEPHLFWNILWHGQTQQPTQTVAGALQALLPDVKPGQWTFLSKLEAHSGRGSTHEEDLPEHY